MPLHLIDRTSELRLFDSALRAAEAGQSRTVLVHGAAGVGKSSLLDSFAQRASDSGAVVLRGIGAEYESGTPLGVIRQLAQAADTAGLPRPPVPQDETPRVEAMLKFCVALRDMSARRPVVCCIDDLHTVDAASLEYFLFLSRHMGPARVALTASLVPHQNVQDDMPSLDVLDRPGLRHIRLGLLGAKATERIVMGRRPGEASTGDGSAQACHRLTGGNPLLLKALLTESRTLAGRHSDWPHPAKGGLFSRTVLACLQGSGAVARDVADSIAVLGEDATTDLIAELLGLSVAHTDQAVAALTSSGLLEGGRFRHQAVLTTVLDGLIPTARAGLHRDAAVLLHKRRLNRTAVARHLSASQNASRPWSHVPWAADVLQEQAECALAEGEPRQAADMLALACEISPDERQRLHLRLQHAAVLWRFDPSAAEQLLRAPMVALDAGRLPSTARAVLDRLLMEQGRFPSCTTVFLPSQRARTSSSGAPAPENGPLTGHRVMWAIPDASGGNATADAEKILASTGLMSGTMHALIRAVRVLLHSGQPEQAVPWCETLRSAAEEQHAPGWASAFAVLHSEVLLHLGDLSGAERCALAAMEHLPQPRTGYFACGPAAALIRARTAMGRHASVAELLEQPIREENLNGVHGLTYRRARGLHHLQTGHAQAALEDFLEVGRTVQRWDMDFPLFLPWRTDAARALLRLGEHHEAKGLVLEQLASPGARHPWVRGITLRLRAEFGNTGESVPLLEDAVEELRRSGDLLELAGALADVGRRAQARGDNAKAGVMTRRAWSLAHACGAEGLREEIVPGLASRGRSLPSRQATLVGAVVDGKLSDSERRVAALAAHGYTNREISGKLYITVSTVEQHLTRTYRKMGISRRQDLPIDLQTNVLELL